jgi:hypothetical protein
LRLDPTFQRSDALFKRARCFGVFLVKLLELLLKRVGLLGQSQ